MPNDSELAKRCSKRIFSGERWDTGGHPCTRKGLLDYEGKKYCKQHYPPNVAGKRAENRLRWNAKWEAENKARQGIEQAQAELARKAAAYDRLVAWLDTGVAGRGRIREILDGEK